VVGRGAFGCRRQFLAAIKFLYARTLGRPHAVAWISFPRAKKRTPKILTGREVARRLAAIEAPTCRAVASVCYSAGLRIKEAGGLVVEAISEKRGSSISTRGVIAGFWRSSAG